MAGEENPPEVVNRLCNENIKLVHYFANRANDIDPSEALSLAYAGLLEAAQVWKEESGIRWATYACNRIKWKLSSHRQRQKAVKRGGRASIVSMDAPLGDEPDSPTLGDRISDDSRLADEVSEFNEGLHMLGAVIGKLPAREQDILRRRFGIGTHAQTLEEIGAHYNLTRERIRQLETIALQKAQRALKEHAAHGLDTMPSLGTQLIIRDWYAWGMSITEIASILKLSPNATQSIVAGVTRNHDKIVIEYSTKKRP